MKATRQEVYEAIDGERDYEDELWPQNGERDNPRLTVGEFLLLIEEYVDKARKDWTVESRPENATLKGIRKIAGIAVNCMENHGALRRQR